jgi:hypothetical protein
MTYHVKPERGIDGHVSRVDIIENADGIGLRVSIDVVFPGLPEEFRIDLRADCPNESTMNLLITAKDERNRKT